MNKNFVMNKQKIINLIIIFIYALVTLLLIVNHEIWADEAQVWLLCKNLSFFELFKHLVNEGHPSFFYLLNMPFIKMGSSIFVMQFICWLSMVGAVFLLLRYSPFNMFSKLAIILSAGFLYYFPVVARSYSILPLLVFSVAILYKKHKELPILYAIILAIIANTHVIMFVFVFLLGCFFVYDNFFKHKLRNKSNVIAVSIIALGLLVVVLQLAGTEASNGSINFIFENIFSSCVRVFVQFFTNSVDYFSVIQLVRHIMPQNVFLYFGLSIILAILFLVLLVFLFFKNKKIFLLAFFSIGFQLAIYIFAYSNMIYPTRNFCAFLIIIFCYWLLLEDKAIWDNAKVATKKMINMLLAMFFILTFMNGFNFATKDLLYNYSSAKDTAEFIKNNIDEDSIIIPTIDAFGLAVYQQALNHHYYSVTKNSFIKYNVWKNVDIYLENNFEDVFNNLLENTLKDKNWEHKKVYILSTNFLHGKNFFATKMPQNYKLIYQSPPCLAIGEVFEVFEYIKQK